MVTAAAACIDRGFCVVAGDSSPMRHAVVGYCASE